MVFRAILLGLIAAFIAAIPRRLWGSMSNDMILNPWCFCFIGILSALIQRFSDFRHKSDPDPIYASGRSLADLILHVHYPKTSLSPWQWIRRGLISLCLAIFGGRAGPEGAACELTHAVAIMTRPRSSNWLETQRRTDAAMVLAAGVAAAFGSPLAAVFFPAELGIGGALTPVVLAAMAATACVHYIGVAPAYSWPVLQLWAGWRDGLALFGVTIATAVTGVLTIRFAAYARDSFNWTFRKQLWLKGIFAGLLLVGVSLAYDAGNRPSPDLLQMLLSEPYSPLEAGLLGLSTVLALTIIISGFGTVGVIWPVFSLGCLVGYAMEPVFPGYPRTSMVAGGAALIGTMFGAPLSGAVLAFEMTGQWTVIVPCFVAAVAASRLRGWLRTDTLINTELSSLNLDLKDGRSKSVLHAIRVREAMVTDHETVLDNELISDVKAALEKSHYPFVVVVNNRGSYSGILSEDEVNEARLEAPVKDQIEYKPLNPILKQFVEAKDLIYRAGRRVPSVKIDDTLDSLGHVFQHTPVVAVIGEKERVVGLLFVHEVRIAYDRELARKHFLHQKGGQML